MFKIYDGRIEFVQWDLNRKIIVEDPTISEVHFCNKTDNCSLVVEVYEKDGLRLANVPNILLQNNWDIRVYGYCGECYTKQYARFKVVGRTKPADYVYTETEIKSWETIAQRCEEVLEEAEAAAKGAVSGKSFMNYEALVEELNNAPKSRYANPQHFYIKTLGVPDVWIYEVREESVPYEYTNDKYFADGVNNNLIQVGYYVLSALETQKVDLDEYVKNTDYTAEGKAGVIKAYKTYGFNVNANGIPNAEAFSKQKYDSASQISFIGKGTLENIKHNYVKEGITTNTETLTDEEKASACEWIGAMTKPAKDDGGYMIIPTINHLGKQGTVRVSYSPLQYALAPYTNGGVLKTNTPQEDLDCANKKYVDDNFVAIPNITAYGNYLIPYIVLENGKVGEIGEPIRYAGSAIQNTIPLRGAGGVVVVGTPTEESHATTKKYVDDLIAAIEARLAAGGL